MIRAVTTNQVLRTELDSGQVREDFDILPRRIYTSPTDTAAVFAELADGGDDREDASESIRGNFRRQLGRNALQDSAVPLSKFAFAFLAWPYNQAATHLFQGVRIVKRIILPIVAWFLIVSPVHATPLTWHFSGTTSASSQFNGMPIGGLDYEFRIFLDTDLVATIFGTFPDIEFSGPHQGEIEIATLGVLRVNMISRVLYHAPGGASNPVNEVQFYAPAFHFAHFASSITNDSVHLCPIPLTATSSGGLNFAFPVIGPNGLSVSGSVTTFAAATDSATAVPEGGSTALLLRSY